METVRTFCDWQCRKLAITQYWEHDGQSDEKNAMVDCYLQLTGQEDQAMWYFHGQSTWGHQRWSVGWQMWLSDSSGRHDFWVTQVKGSSESWIDAFSLYMQSWPQVHPSSLQKPPWHPNWLRAGCSTPRLELTWRGYLVVRCIVL